MSINIDLLGRDPVILFESLLRKLASNGPDIPDFVATSTINYDSHESTYSNFLNIRGTIKIPDPSMPANLSAQKNYYVISKVFYEQVENMSEDTSEFGPTILAIINNTVGLFETGQVQQDFSEFCLKLGTTPKIVTAKSISESGLDPQSLASIISYIPLFYIYNMYLNHYDSSVLSCSSNVCDAFTKKPNAFGGSLIDTIFTVFLIYFTLKNMIVVKLTTIYSADTNRDAYITGIQNIITNLDSSTQVDDIVKEEAGLLKKFYEIMANFKSASGPAIVESIGGPANINKQLPIDVIALKSVQDDIYTERSKINSLQAKLENVEKRRVKYWWQRFIFATVLSIYILSMGIFIVAPISNILNDEKKAAVIGIVSLVVLLAFAVKYIVILVHRMNGRRV